MITLALPKGRLAKDLGPILDHAGLALEPAYFDESDRRLIYTTDNPNVRVVPIKPFDVATIVATGGANLGIVGADVVAEFDYSELYVPISFPFGPCRLSVAGPKGFMMPKAGETVRVASKYPNLTRRFFHRRGINLTLIPMSGALELAPHLGLADCIVDLVSTGATLRANDLVECEVILESSARLVVGRQAYQTGGGELHSLLGRFLDLTSGLASGPEPEALPSAKAMATGPAVEPVAA